MFVGELLEVPHRIIQLRQGDVMGFRAVKGQALLLLLKTQRRLVPPFLQLQTAAGGIFPEDPGLRRKIIENTGGILIFGIFTQNAHGIDLLDR